MRTREAKAPAAQQPQGARTTAVLSRAAAQHPLSKATGLAPLSDLRQHVEASPVVARGAALQRQATARAHPPPLQPKSDPGGLPHPLKTGVEQLSGVSMDGVTVHRNSGEPAKVGALAYAQGRDIHLGPGQDKHLPHEAWHVAQQAQGRVKRTMQAKGVAINNDPSLEREADVMGARAAARNVVQRKDAPFSGRVQALKASTSMASPVVQRLVGFEFQTVWKLKKASSVDWDSDTVLASGKSWKLSPDEISGDHAVIEFKTDPFNVDGDDYESLLEPVKASIGDLQGYVKNSLLTLEVGKYSLLPTSSNYKGRIAVEPNGPVTAKPQATGGVRRDLILDFYKDMLKNGKAADLLPGQTNKETLKQSIDYVDPKTSQDTGSSKEFAGVVVFLADLIRRLQADKTTYEHYVKLAKERLDGEYADFRNDTSAQFKLDFAEKTKFADKKKDEIFWSWVEDKISKEKHDQMVKEVDESVSAEIAELRENAMLRVSKEKERLIKEYTETENKLKKRYTPSYGKARAPALPRVAFNDLPMVSNEYLIKHVLLAAGLKETDGNLSMYPMGFKFGEGWDKLTIADWIKRIQKNKGNSAGELWSARSLGEGKVGSGDKEGIGIPFELRGLPGPVPYKDWLTWAKPYLDYFRQLNTKNKPAK